MLLRDKVVFLTGGANGIGLECAKAYAREGARVVVADIDRTAGEAVVSELPVAGLSVECDVSDEESVRMAILATLSEFSEIHAVHNNTGVSGPAAPLNKTTSGDWDRLMSVNLKVGGRQICDVQAARGRFSQ